MLIDLSVPTNSVFRPIQRADQLIALAEVTAPACYS